MNPALLQWFNEDGELIMAAWLMFTDIHWMDTVRMLRDNFLLCSLFREEQKISLKKRCLLKQQLQPT